MSVSLIVKKKKELEGVVWEKILGVENTHTFDTHTQHPKQKPNL
jgi:hypothetical protein